MQTVGIGWLALELSNSAFIVGAVSAAGSLPVLFLSLYGGVLADRYSKLKLVQISQVLLLVEASMIWWFAWSGNMTISWLIALAAFGGIVSSVEIPARQALIIELVHRDDIVEAVALNSAGFNLARIIGPSIAAIVIASLGLSWCFAINALSYFAVLVSLFSIKLAKWVAAENPLRPIEGMRQGLGYIRHNRKVLGVISLMAVYSIFGFQYLTMMPVIARDVLHTDATGYGCLLTCVGVGAVTGALLLATLGTRSRRGKMLARSATFFAIMTILFSLVGTIPVAAVTLFFLGMGMLINGAVANGILQATVPDELRGRVMSAYVFVYVGFTPIGSLLAGVVARATRVEWAIGSGGVIMLAFASWVFWRYPEIAEA
jgi:MFS family permease